MTTQRELALIAAAAIIGFSSPYLFDLSILVTLGEKKREKMREKKRRGRREIGYAATGIATRL